MTKPFEVNKTYSMFIVCDYNGVRTHTVTVCGMLIISDGCGNIALLDLQRVSVYFSRETVCPPGWMDISIRYKASLAHTNGKGGQA